jgi:hypothetical protein
MGPTFGLDAVEIRTHPFSLPLIEPRFLGRPSHSPAAIPAERSCPFNVAVLPMQVCIPIEQTEGVTQKLRKDVMSSFL